MTQLLIALSCLIPSTAFVHVGHLGGLAGHDHYVIAAAAGTSLKGRDEDASFEDEPELQET